MKATIWARDIVLPTGFCYNCGEPPSQHVELHSEGGIAAGAAKSHGLLVAAVAAAVVRHGPAIEIPYCDRCARTAHKKAPDRIATAIALALVALGFGAVAAITDGVTRMVCALVALACAGGFVAWIRYAYRPPEPGQTTRWRAFAVLNQGKDLFHWNREFTRIEYSNPIVIREIIRLNPGIEVTMK